MTSMMTSLTIAMGLGAAFWGAGYLILAAVALPLERVPYGRAWRVYWGLIAPGAFTSLLGGIWWLHRQPALLQEGFVHGMVLGVGALIIIDYLCFRSLGRPGAGAPLTRALIPATGAFILGGIVIVGITGSGSA
jgi:hypothetical protein